MGTSVILMPSHKSNIDGVKYPKLGRRDIRKGLIMWEYLMPDSSARFSLYVGFFVLIILLYSIISNPVILDQIFRYGFR